VAVVYRYRADADVHDLAADLGMKYAKHRQERILKGGADMNVEYGIMHNRRGYFIGHWILGHVKRLSLEFFPDASSCMQAIQTRNWTRRSAH